MTLFTRLLWSVFALLVVGLGVFYLSAAADEFPAMNIDAPAHMAPILNYKAGHGLGAVVWPLTRDYDPTGQHRFLQYPPLFHLVVAGLISRPEMAQVYLCLAALAVTALVSYAALISWSPTAGGTARTRPHWVILAGLSLGALSTWLYMLPSSGRAEALATPLVVLGAMVTSRAPRHWQPLLAGLFIGVTAAAQIAVGVLLGLFYAGYAARQHRGAQRTASAWTWLVAVAQAATAALAAFAVCLLFSPYPLLETLRGITVHLSILPVGEFTVASYYIFPATNATFYGLFFAVLLGHYLWWNARRLTWLEGASLALFVVAAWKLSVQSPNRSYNLLTLRPLFFAVALNLLTLLDDAVETAPDELRRRTQWRRGGAYAVYVGLFILMCVGLVRQAALFNVFVRRGVQVAEARRAYGDYQKTAPVEPVAFDCALLPLLDNLDHAYQRFAAIPSSLDSLPEKQKPRLIVHQWYGRFLSPPEISGYRLAWDDFVAQPPPRVVGLLIANAMPGYSFAIYEPITP